MVSSHSLPAVNPGVDAKWTINFFHFSEEEVEGVVGVGAGQTLKMVGFLMKSCGFPPPDCLLSSLRPHSPLFVGLSAVLSAAEFLPSGLLFSIPLR